MRLPATLPTRAVRRLHCARCGRDFAVAALRENRLTFEPQGVRWKLLSVPIAAAIVILALLLLRGGGESPSPVAATAAPQPPAGEHAARQDKHGSGPSKKALDDAHLVAGVNYTLALPAGWERVDPPAGATFAAEAKDGGANATLWITEDRKLDLPTFVSQSMTQLETLAGSAHVVERIPAPTADGTIVRLAADAPAGQPSYEVTLRVSGPYRYYLASSVDPDAPSEAEKGAALVTESFTPTSASEG